MRQNPKRGLRGKGIEPGTAPNNQLACATIFTLLACLCFAPVSSWSQAVSSSANAVSPTVSSQNFTGRALGNDSLPQKTAGDSGELIPLGVAPPAGQHWHVQVNDKFDEDDSIKQALWNGGTGGGMPPGFCGTPATSCGYTGEDCKSYFGTYPKPPFETIERGQGLSIQATHAAPGDQKYLDNQMADIQSYGKITIHPGSFVQWEAKMPTDREGEGDGWHVDLWCSTLVRHRCDDSSEVDVAEKVLSMANSSEASYIVHAINRWECIRSLRLAIRHPEVPTSQPAFIPTGCFGSTTTKANKDHWKLSSMGSRWSTILCRLMIPRGAAESTVTPDGCSRS